VVEGVETQADYELVSGLECDEIQGYFVAKPMLPSDFIQWLSNFNNPNNVL